MLYNFVSGHYFYYNPVYSNKKQFNHSVILLYWPNHWLPNVLVFTNDSTPFKVDSEEALCKLE